MGSLGFYLATVLALIVAGRASAQSLFTLVTPNVLRVGSKETIVVEAPGATAPLEVKVRLWDFPQKTALLDEATARLGPKNQGLALVTVKQQYKPISICLLFSGKGKQLVIAFFMRTLIAHVPAESLPKDFKGKQHVYVQAEFPDAPLEQVLLLSFNSGYIFTQTDKTLYAPGNTEIMNPDGIVMEKFHMISMNHSGIIPGNYKLPDITNLGTWKIVSAFQHTPQKSFTAEFEVKEYVMPSFEVRVEPEQNFFYVDDEELTVDISARFLYGKPVEGQAFVLFGLMKKEEKKSLPSSLQKTPVLGGKGKTTLTQAMVQSRFPEPQKTLEYSIYVAVTVLTDTGNDMVEVEKTGIPIVNSRYKIFFSKASKYFKPGLPYNLRVRRSWGSPISLVPIFQPFPSPQASLLTHLQGFSDLLKLWGPRSPKWDPRCLLSGRSWPIQSEMGLGDPQGSTQLVDWFLLKSRAGPPQSPQGHWPICAPGQVRLLPGGRVSLGSLPSSHHLHQEATKSHFSCLLPTQLSVSDPDGSPAAGVPVSTDAPWALSGVTQADGTLELVINTPVHDSSLELRVRTTTPHIPAHRQVLAFWKVLAYQPQDSSKNYLHLSVPRGQAQPGKPLNVNFHLQSNSADVQRSVDYFIYLVVNKGRIVKAGRQPRLVGQGLVSLVLPITPTLIPSFRLVAYYRVPGTGEIVADSLWVDLADTCMGTLRVTEATPGAGRVHLPGEHSKIKVQGDPGASVGLVVVDKALYILSKKKPLSQAKIWDAVEKSDLGCGWGGGANSRSVFAEAGLGLQTHSGAWNHHRTFGPRWRITWRRIQQTELRRDHLPISLPETHCSPTGHRRRRRSPLLSQEKAAKAQEYQDQQLRRCCEDGMQENSMGYSCARRSHYILEGQACVTAFLACCHHIFGGVLLPKKTLLSSSTSSLSKIIKFRNPKEVFLSNTEMLLKTFTPLVSREEVEEEEEDEEEEEFLQYDNIISRSQFPESWLWQMETLPLEVDREGLASKMVDLYLKDSITTWEVLAVSLAQERGLCVAAPYDITVMKDVFIDLRLPYSVVRNEQVAVRAVLYNHASQDIRVRVELMHNPKLCSASSPTRPFQQEVMVPAGKSHAINYVLIPIELGEAEVEVKAALRGFPMDDGVRKLLRVVPEGVRICKTIKNLILDPRNKSGTGQQLERVEPLDLSDVVPNTEPVTFISIKGDPLADTVENSIDGANLQHLIRVPSGCGEQNMIGMTPSVIATHYLDATGQWDRIGVERRSEAIRLIKQGYTQQMVYRKADDSYAAFTNRPASTWLTAYVVKVFASASSLVPVNPEVLCGAVKWLILEKQKPDGKFQEDAPVIHGEMVGGTRGSDPEASLTAFVLIALVEAKDICGQLVRSLDRSIEKSGSFLTSHLGKLSKAYSMAITSYALALQDPTNQAPLLLAHSQGMSSAVHPHPRGHHVPERSPKTQMVICMFRHTIGIYFAQLMSGEGYFNSEHRNSPSTLTLSSPTTLNLLACSLELLGYPAPGPAGRSMVGAQGWAEQAFFAGGTHWPDPQSHLYTLEATAYALLALLKMGRWELATPIAQWLVEQQYYGGGYGSTQATITVFQALAQYQLTTPPAQDTTLDITLNLLGRSHTTHWRIHSDDSMLARTEQTRLNNGFTVTATGTGRATLSVMTVYYQPLSDATAQCKNFDLRVSVRNAPESERARMKAGEGRVKRPEGSLGSVDIEICMRYLGAAAATMTILDVSMLTGFSPDTGDLEKLSNQVDRYISQFELDTALSERGSLIIYLDKVSRTEEECLMFKAHQHFQVGLIQPASVTIYEYYAPENRCTRFYHPTKAGGLLSTFCQDATCRCMEEHCTLMKKFEGHVTVTERVEAACEGGMDYVFKAELLEVQRNGMYNFYIMRVLEVIKEGSEAGLQGKSRRFVSPIACQESLGLVMHQTYLIWGHGRDLWNLKPEMAYLLGSNTWIEWWPHPDECGAGGRATMAQTGKPEPNPSARCSDLQAFALHMQTRGCPN
ncbi:LOW QUALITY PROTEIN: complement C3-like [Ornithorhynchus anatinus]|uniref:LOW QUALITY PROTEIN: complement C3-like n=1 Tax=Ornithorhynchus anatinus TaxID=9258 RepID=UPI0019D44186|nr:LOW QUALITY PROTEIN: complement C3-like [Ornithorhynchus anatinus]